MAARKNNKGKSIKVTATTEGENNMAKTANNTTAPNYRDDRDEAARLFAALVEEVEGQPAEVSGDGWLGNGRIRINVDGEEQTFTHKQLIQAIQELEVRLDGVTGDAQEAEPVAESATEDKKAAAVNKIAEQRALQREKEQLAAQEKASANLADIVESMINHTEAQNAGRLGIGKDLVEFDKVANAMKSNGLIKNDKQALAMVGEAFEMRGKQLPDKTQRSKTKGTYTAWCLGTGHEISDTFTSPEFVRGDRDGAPVKDSPPVTTSPDSDELAPMSLTGAAFDHLYALKSYVTPSNIERLLAFAYNYNWPTIQGAARVMQMDQDKDNVDEIINLFNSMSQEEIDAFIERESGKAPKKTDSGFVTMRLSREVYETYMIVKHRFSVILGKEASDTEVIERMVPPFLPYDEATQTGMDEETFSVWARSQVQELTEVEREALTAQVSQATEEEVEDEPEEDVTDSELLDNSDEEDEDEIDDEEIEALLGETEAMPF